ncbi:MAG: peptidase [Verrucomicrobiales bacterium]|nr:peptidase [Verrucomicrobiales bacterium]
MIVLVSLLIFFKWATQLWLERLNAQRVRQHSSHIPDALKSVVDEPTYRKSIDYTLAKNKLHQLELTYDALILSALLFSGFLPWIYGAFQNQFGHSIWAGAAFLFALGVVLAIPSLPFGWYSQFRLEQRFGFNTTTPKLWILDRLKGLVLALVVGYPLLILILKLVGSMGPHWWIWAWACVFFFQLLMLVLAPVLIMPLFNKFTPLTPGPLRDRLLALGERTGFHAKSIQVMDGSKRSRHSNAFFTGFNRFRKIVLFDTLIEQLTPPELEAVLAHEIGHYKKGHIPKMLIWSAITLLGGFVVLSVLLQQEWFFAPFGFHAGDMTIALLLFTLLGGLITFWFTPLAHWWSRKYEYEADAYAAGIMGEIESMTGALRKLNEKNLSNLTPHPFYSGFYYSHPTLLEREQSLRVHKSRT